jgi:hypothetical protein
MPEIVYTLCALTSVLCAVVLARSYRRRRSRLLLWSSLGFVGLAINNALLLIDLVALPTVDLSPLRAIVSAASMLTLAIGLVWDSD